MEKRVIAFKKGQTIPGKIKKQKWDIKVWHYSRNKKIELSLDKIDFSKLEIGDSLKFTIHYPNGKQIGYADFGIKNIKDPDTNKTDKGVDLGEFKLEDFKLRHQGIMTKNLMPIVIKFIDQNNINISGIIVPLAEDTEIGKLTNLYLKLGGKIVSNKDGVSMMFRKAHPERWSVSGKGKGWHGESERHSQAAKKGKQSLDMVLWDIAQTFESVREDFLALDSQDLEFEEWETEKLWDWKKEDIEAIPPKDFRYNPNLKYEAEYNKQTKKIEIGNKFFEYTPEEKKHILYHERGHKWFSEQGLMKEFWDIQESGIFGKDGNWNYSYNLEESIAESFALFHSDPKFLKEKHHQSYSFFKERGVKSRGKGWYGESERHSKARKTGKADFTEDAYAQSRMPGSKFQKKEPYTKLQERMEQLKKYEKAYQSEVGKQLRAIDPKAFMPSIESISVPFEITNSETGAVVQGSVLQSFEKNIKQLTPVSSSTVRGVGQFGNELLVQFHPSKGQNMRTYRYMFDDPQQAAQAYQSLTSTGSPGRWIWQNLRGHSAGEPTGIKNVPNKYGPSLSPPGKGTQVIGGTTSSLVDYSISNRTPADRVPNFDEMVKQMKRSTSNPVSDPQTGSAIEESLSQLRPWRDVGMKELMQSTRRQLSQLPKLDFTVIAMGDFTDDYLVETHSKTSKLGKKFMVNEHHRGEGIKASEREWSPEDVKDWTEWEKSLEERHKLAKLGETINPQFPMDEHQKKAYLQYIDTKFFTKRNNRMLESCSDKLMISRAIDPGEIPLEDLGHIFYIDSKFKELPQSMQDSITEVRIHPNAVNDHLYGETKDSNIAGFWVPWRKSVTIGMYNSYFNENSSWNMKEPKSWLNEILVHEGAHALDDTKLTQKELKTKRDLFKKYKGRLTRHYAGKNEDEFFAEAFTYNYLVRHDKLMKSGHHEKLMETETDINFFINSIIDKYDFLKDMLWEKVEVLKV